MSRCAPEVLNAAAMRERQDLQVKGLPKKHGWPNPCCAVAGASAGHAQGQGTITCPASQPGTQPSPCCASTCSACARAHPAQGQDGPEHSVRKARDRGGSCAAEARHPWTAPCPDSAQEQAASAAGRSAHPGAGGTEARRLCHRQSIGPRTGVPYASAHFPRSQARLLGCSLDITTCLSGFSCHVRPDSPHCLF